MAGKIRFRNREATPLGSEPFKRFEKFGRFAKTARKRLNFSMPVDEARQSTVLSKSPPSRSLITMFFFIRFATLQCIALLVTQAFFLLDPAQAVSDSTEQLYSLHMRQSSDRIADVRVEYEADGQLKMPSDEGGKEVEMHVSAELTFQDRFLADTALGSRDRSLCAGRYYRQLNVNLRIGEITMQPTLRDSRRLIGLCRQQNGSLDYFCPDGPLTREEVDLIRLPGDRQALSMLLPKHSVHIGAVWKPEPAAFAALLALDVVGDSDVKSKLTGVERDFARVEFEGVVHGALAGVATEIAIKGRYYFFLRHGEFASLQLVTREQRGIGHINPGVDVTARLKMRLEPESDAGYLSDSKIAMLRQSNPQERKLHYESSDLGVSFDYDTAWYATAEDRQAIVFRQLFRGDLIAQCNVSRLPRIKKGKALTLSQFQKDIRENLNKNFGSFIEAGEKTSERGYLIYRVESVGTASAIPVRWIYYLLSDTTGRRLAIVFTMEQDQKKEFGDADRDWVRSLEFIASSQQNLDAEENAKEETKGFTGS